MRTTAIVASILVFSALGAAVPPCRAADPGPPDWWADAADEAAADGYRLITPAAVKTLYDTGNTFVILDTRPGYEYHWGHLPGASNMTFVPGDRLVLSPEKEAGMRRLLGPDKERIVVVYCRDFR